jgi:hypothetical protein
VSTQKKSCIRIYADKPSLLAALESDPSIPLAAVNGSDFPTNTTGVLVNKDGTFARAPLYYNQKKYDTIDPSPYAHKPPAPNDVPLVKERKKKASAKAGETGSTTPADAAKDKAAEAVTPVKGAAVSTSQATQPITPQKMTTRSLKSKHQHQKRADEKIYTGDELLGTGTGWNGRLMAVGNGGQRGMVPFTEVSPLSAC